MTPRGLVVVGAGGSLGGSFTAEAKKRVDMGFWFDRVVDPDRGIAACNLSDQSSINSAMLTLPIRKASVWHLFVASGHYVGDRETSLAWPDLSASLSTNLLGTVLLVARFIELVEASKARGRIVLTTSAAAKVGSRDIGYGVSKAGIEGLVRSVSKVYAQRGITTIGLAPGIFKSKMSDLQNPERRMQAIMATHTQRLTALEEITKCALFLTFDAPDALTGTIVGASSGQVCV